MNLHINVIDGKIVLTFDKPYSWLAFTESEARFLIDALDHAVAEIPAPNEKH